VLYFQAINLSNNLHHNCDCASKEKQAQQERSERTQDSRRARANDSAPYLREAHAQVAGLRIRLKAQVPWYSRTTIRIVALLAGLVGTGYFTYREGMWRIAIKVLLVLLFALLLLLVMGILSSALMRILKRRSALRKHRITQTISLIEDTLRAEAGAKH